MAWFKTDYLQLANGSRVAIVTDPNPHNTRSVSIRDALVLNDVVTEHPLEIRNTTRNTTTGFYEIELERVYEGVTLVDATAFVMPISGAFQEAAMAIRNLLESIDIESQLLWMEEWYTSPADTMEIELSDGSFITINTYGFYARAFDVQLAAAEAAAAAALASEIAAGLSADAAEADRIQTGLDAIATAADRVQTGLDVLATAADAVATAADRVQTGLDATATAADAAATGLDATATAADRVQTGLDRAQTTADAAATAADATATAADRVQTGLDRAQTTADAVATGLDATATAADRVQTTADAAAASASAAAALSEANRASVIAGELDYAIRGEGYFDPTTGSYPLPADIATPSIWFSTNIATIDGVNWTVGDSLSYIPHQTDPAILGEYYRVAGELAVGGVPQPLEIADDLIMQQEKRIRFRTDPVNDVATLQLDANGDIIIGDVDSVVSRMVDARNIGLAGTGSVDKISSLAPDGTATSVNPLLYGPATVGSVAATGVDNISNQTVGGAKNFATDVTVALGQNTAPVDGSIKLHGYGLLGNRSALYFTNVNPIGTVSINIGDVHGAGGRKLTVTPDDATFNVPLNVVTPTTDTHAANKGYVDGQNATQNTAIALNTAKVGITPEQSSAIALNTAKVGITTEQSAAIVVNTAKVGITTEQASAITTNTAKVGITTEQAAAITANTAKVGITPAQASAITANTTARTGGLIAGEPV